MDHRSADPEPSSPADRDDLPQRRLAQLCGTGLERSHQGICQLLGVFITDYLLVGPHVVAQPIGLAAEAVPARWWQGTHRLPSVLQGQLVGRLPRPKLQRDGEAAVRGQV